MRKIWVLISMFIMGAGAVAAAVICFQAIMVFQAKENLVWQILAGAGIFSVVLGYLSIILQLYDDRKGDPDGNLDLLLHYLFGGMLVSGIVVGLTI